MNMQDWLNRQPMTKRDAIAGVAACNVLDKLLQHKMGPELIVMACGRVTDEPPPPELIDGMGKLIEAMGKEFADLIMVLDDEDEDGIIVRAARK